MSTNASVAQRKERCIALVREKRFIKGKEIALELGVTTRQVYRYMQDVLVAERRIGGIPGRGYLWLERNA